ncbi:MAG: MaoC family dehydratase [Deltaproteobacteria bacterium]|nr:MAG: MaoC family dehydratase [Deltaproteobacteria bacterium]
MSYIRRKAIEGIKVGDTFSISRTFTEHDVLQFADISRDYNPVHFEKRFTDAKRLNGRICHGLLVASLITEIGGQIGWFASGMNFHFREPVYFGDKIQCDLTITAIDDRGRAKAEAVYTNQDQITVLEGVLTGIMPGTEEKEVMKAMVAEGDPTNRLR